ncbi:integration host factor subunit beta [Treponema putidum]|nr:integration host factor subunit beta [Treponema putidum]
MKKNRKTCSGLRYFLIMIMKKKRSKIDIIDSVYRKNSQYQLKQINCISNLFLEELSMFLKQGIPVEIRGLGTFDFTVLQGKKNARNPKTGEKVLTYDRCKIRFKPGKELKGALRKIDTQELIDHEK